MLCSEENKSKEMGQSYNRNNGYDEATGYHPSDNSYQNQQGDSMVSADPDQIVKTTNI